MLKEAHDLFVMFFGYIRGMLQKHPVGDLARSCLHAFFPDYLAGKVHRFIMRSVSQKFCMNQELVIICLRDIYDLTFEGLDLNRIHCCEHQVPKPSRV